MLLEPLLENDTPDDRRRKQAAMQALAGEYVAALAEGDQFAATWIWAAFDEAGFRVTDQGDVEPKAAERS